MDTLSQFALGAAIGVAVMHRRTKPWKAALIGGLAATLPDLDAIYDHGDPVSNITLHRANSHALFWLTLASPLVAFIAAVAARERDRFMHWWLAVWLALVTHPILSLTSHFPRLSVGWADAAIRQILRRRSPRVPGASLEIEWFQLCHAINPNGLVVVLEMEPSPHGAFAVVYGFEWLAANGNAAIAIPCRELPPSNPPFDRLLYGARRMIPDVLGSEQIGAAKHEPVGSEVVEIPDVMLVLPPVNGRPHPLSLIEQRLSKMIEADGELRSKFVFNTHPGAWPDMNFTLAHMKRSIQALERAKFDAFFMADHMAVLNMPLAALKAQPHGNVVRAVHAALGAVSGHGTYRPCCHRIDYV